MYTVENKDGSMAGMFSWGRTWRDANPMARAFPKQVQRLTDDMYEKFMQGVEFSDNNATR